MFDAEFKARMLNAGRRPCPRCGRPMAEYLSLCWDCQWMEAERARRQETFDQLMMDAGLEAREADRLDYEQERREMAQCGGF